MSNIFFVLGHFWTLVTEDYELILILLEWGIEDKETLSTFWDNVFFFVVIIFDVVVVSVSVSVVIVVFVIFVSATVSFSIAVSYFFCRNSSVKKKCTVITVNIIASFSGDCCKCQQICDFYFWYHWFGLCWW